jgi:glycosyltransferase involved in cell wall biosynthesis
MDSKRILWFTDTLTDLNGVSVTLRNAAWTAHRMGKDVRIVTSLTQAEQKCEKLPPNVMNLPHYCSFKLPYYEHLSLKLPSIPESTSAIADFKPDEVIISTPGPVGLLGLFMAKSLNIWSTGIYHTDFTLQAGNIVGNPVLEGLIENGLKWFYSNMDEIKVPTREYIDILVKRGFEQAKMSVFERGINLDIFKYRKNAGQKVRKMFRIKDGPILMYSGRISKDKNLAMLKDVYISLLKARPNLNLLIAGDGPYLEEFRNELKSLPRAVFTGKLSQKELPLLYSASDLFLFPSATDTFGMVVLEAQACGVPAIVSNVGGPKEIIIEKVTGLIANFTSRLQWKRRIEQVLKLKETALARYKAMRDNAAKNIREKYSWKKVIEKITSLKIRKRLQNWSII